MPLRKYPRRVLVIQRLVLLVPFGLVHPKLHGTLQRRHLMHVVMVIVLPYHQLDSMV